MDFLTFIAKLTEHLVWPIAIIIIAVILKKPVSNIMEKLKKANIKGSEFEFFTRPVQDPEKLETTSVNIPIHIGTDGVQKEFEELIRRDLKAVNIEDSKEKEKMLVSHLASSQLNVAYERVNSSIYGSQIDLLRSLNSTPNPVDINSLKFFYDNAMTKYPEFYKNYTFQSYVSYLSNMGIITQQENGYLISKFGVGYLIYIAEKGLTGFRHY